VLFDADTGFTRKGTVDLDGIAAVLDLRSRFGQPKKTLGRPRTYYDPSYLNCAVAAE